MKATHALLRLAMMVILLVCFTPAIADGGLGNVGQGLRPGIASGPTPTVADSVELPPNIEELTCSTFSPGASKASDWRHLESEIGEIVAGPGVSQAAATRARSTLEHGTTFLKKSFGIQATASNQLSICLVSERQSIAAIPGMNADPSVAGAAVTGARLAVVAVDTTSVDLDRIVLHETAHLLASERARAEAERALPMWLSEGLAELAASEVLGTTDGIHHAAANLRTRGALPSVRELQLGLREGASHEEIQRFYAASTSATAYLVSIEGWNRIWEMLRITGKLPAEFEANWHAHLITVS